MAIGVLEHVGIIFDDIEGARHLLRDIFKLPEARCSNSPDGPAYAFRAGGTVLRVVTPHVPDAAIGRSGLHHLTFRVDSLVRAREQLQEAGIPIMSDSPPDPAGRPSFWADPSHTIGIPLQFVEQGEKLQFPPPIADGFIERVDHLGVACRNNQVARQVYAEGLGFPQECTQIDSEVLVRIETTSNDKYGVVCHAHPPQHVVGSGLAALFITVGEFELEIMQPLSAAHLGVPLGTIPGSVGQDQGAIARFLERRGEGLLHVGFKTPNIQQALDAVAAQGVKLIDPVGRPGGRAGLIAFMDFRSTQGILFHFVQRTP